MMTQEQKESGDQQNKLVKDFKSLLEKEKFRESDIIKDEPSFDPFQVLPIEIITNIMLLLPQDDVQMNCLQVSKLWWNQILGCTELWSKVLLNDETNDELFISLASYLGDCLKYLTVLPSASKDVQTRFMTELRNGRYKALRALKLSEVALDHFKPLKFEESGTAGIFSSRQIENTLTRLEIDVGNNDRYHPIYITEIFQVFENLTDLYYTTTKTFSFQPPNKANRVIIPHQRLVNLQLKQKEVNGDQVELIALSCPQLRRLYMYKCEYSVLDAIIKVQNDNPTALENLEILIFNSSDTRNPPLPVLPPSTATNIDRIKEKRKKGIRIIYACVNGDPIPERTILPLIYHCRHTLETLAGSFYRRGIEIRELTNSELVSEEHPNFRLENLRNMTFWLGEGLRDFLLRSIHGSTSFKWLELQDRLGLDDQFVDFLLNSPPLDHLKFYVTNTTLRNSGKLIQLLDRYAQLSENSGRSLKSIAFTENDFIITDPILEALSNIKSLEEVWLYGPYFKTSPEQLQRTINKLGKQQLKGISLASVGREAQNIIVGDTLGNIANKLSWIQLQNLIWLTDHGVQTLVDKLEKNSQMTLLIIDNCRMVTSECINYARKKVKTVIYDVAPCQPYDLSLFNNNSYSGSSHYK